MGFYRFSMIFCFTLFSVLSNSQYTVVPGDTLYEIAEAHNVDIALLEAENPQISNFDLIFPGQVINLPVPKGVTHIVVNGDTLYNLAITFNADFECLKNGNPQISNPDLIFPGDLIQIPASCPPFNPGQLPTTITKITHFTTVSTVSSTSAIASTQSSSTLSTITKSISSRSSSAGSSSSGSSSTRSSSTRSSSTRSSSSRDTSSSTHSQSTTSSQFASTRSNQGTSKTLSQTSATTLPPSTVTDIVIGGTTFTIGTISSTITETDGSTIIVGPGGVIIGSQTISIPHVTGPTTITTGGETITLGAGPPVTAGQPPSSTLSEIIIEGSTYTIGPGAVTVTEADGSEITIGPSGITIGTQTITLPSISGSTATIVTSDGFTITIQPGSDTSTTTASAPPSITTAGSQPTEVVIIGTQTLTIGPLQSTVTNDGTTFVIGGPGGGVVVGTETFDSFPTGSTTLVSDGVTLTVGPVSSAPVPGQSGTPAIIALQPMASQLFDLIAAAAAGIAIYAALELETAAAVSELTGLLTNAAQLSDAFGAAVGAIELDTLTSEGRKLATDALTSSTQSGNFLRNALRLLLNKSFTFKRKTILLLSALAAQKWIQLSAGILLLAVFLVPQDTSSTLSIISTTTSTFTTSTTTSSTSSTSSFPAAPTEWFIATEPGTSLLSFKALTLGLPDDGISIVYPDLPSQGYVTNMTFLEAFIVSLIPFVSTVWINDPLLGEGNDEIVEKSQPPTKRSKSQREDSGNEHKTTFKLDKRIAPFSGNIVKQLNSPRHLNVLSQDSLNALRGTLPDYQYDPGPRNVITLYIIDKGFMLDHFEFNGRQPVRQYVVPTTLDRRIVSGIRDVQYDSAFTLPDVHGTSVASIAVGARLGVLKDAIEWVAVKYKERGSGAPAAIFDGFSHIVQDVISNQRQRKAVINFSGGFETRATENVPGHLGNDIFEHILLPQFAANGIVFVQSAGNDGQAQPPIFLEDRSPQKFGGPASPIILVGGTNPDGTGWDGTTPSNANPNILLSVSGLGNSVETADARDPAVTTKTVFRAGTSFAAPAVAALAAYYMGTPALYGVGAPLEAVSNQAFVLQVKRYIVDKATVRQVLGNPISPNGNPPVAYNQAVLEQGCTFQTTTPPRPPRPLDRTKRQFTTVAAVCSCGTPRNCQLNECVGTVVLGIATCKNEFPGCTCIPDINTPGFSCGQPLSCEKNDCDGRFSNGKATCTNAFAGCECFPSTQTPGFNCGDPLSCELNNCGGIFEQGTATCRNDFAGCTCLPSVNTPGFSCGPPLSCELNNCGGTFANGEATCKEAFAGCACIPSIKTPGFSCGAPKSCGQNNCDGKVTGTTATCQNAFAGCDCTPDTTTPGFCGPLGPCDFSGCQGTFISGNQFGTCQAAAHKGCSCVADAGTPGFCGPLASCDFVGCQGIDVGTQFGQCQASSHKGCSCILPAKTTTAPAPPQSPPPQSCDKDCTDMLNLKINGLKDQICTNDPDNDFIDTGSTGFVDWFRLDSNQNCFIMLAKSSTTKGFPDPICFFKTDIQNWITENALGCNSGDDFFRPSPPINVGGFVGEGEICLSNFKNYQICGSSTMNGGIPISG